MGRGKGGGHEIVWKQLTLQDCALLSGARVQDGSEHLLDILKGGNEPEVSVHVGTNDVRKNVK